MKARRAARRLALDVLYEAEIRDKLPLEAFEARRAGGWVVVGSGDVADESPSALLALDEQPPPEALEYAHELLEGVQEHHLEIDRLIAAHADRWAIERMPVLDRNILRIAIFELLWRRADIPIPVAINEAVDVAKELSTEDSGRFINGLLGRIADQDIRQ